MKSQNNKINLVKVGGSLLRREGLAAKLGNYLDNLNSPLTVLICGGGSQVERLRQQQIQFNLSANECHTNSILVMDRNTRHVCDQLQATVLNDWNALRQTVTDSSTQEQTNTVIGFEVSNFMALHEPQLPPPLLPSSWETTSDSIAARIASVLDADLHLLKSATPPVQQHKILARRGYVDGQFPVTAANISSVRLVDLFH